MFNIYKIYIHILFKIESIIINENSLNDFEFIDVPLPPCFDLSKPFQLNDNSFTDSMELTSSYFNTLDSNKKKHFIFIYLFIFFF